MDRSAVKNFNKTVRTFIKRYASLITLSILIYVGYSLSVSFKNISADELRQALFLVSGTQIFYSVICAAFSFLFLAISENLINHFLNVKVGFFRTAKTSFIANAISNYFSFAGMSGLSVRARLYKRQGVGIRQVVNSNSLGSLYLWLGYILLCTGAIMFFELPKIASLYVPRLMSSAIPWLGLATLTLFLTYNSRHKQISLPARFTLKLPELSQSILQIALSSVDWIFSAFALYILLPGGYELSFTSFMSVFLVSQLLSVVLHIPGGIGILDTLILASSPSSVTSSVLGALIVYRIIFYLLPLAVALSLLAVEELEISSPLFFKSLKIWMKSWGKYLSYLLAAVTFASGASLISSGLSYSDPARTLLLSYFVSLKVINLSHFMSGIIGPFLILISWAIYKRTNAAFYVSMMLLALGGVLAILRDLNFSQAGFFAFSMVAVYLGRGTFHRQASFFSQKFTGTWIFATSLLMIGFGALLSSNLIFQTEDSWWNLWSSNQNLKIVRYCFGSSVVLTGFAMHWLLQPKANPVGLHTEDLDYSKVKNVLAKSSQTTGNLSLIGDKKIVFSEKEDAFIMYSVYGNTWVAMGDPVGESSSVRNLTQKFEQLADRFGGHPLFYEVRPDQASMYHDLGFHLLKIGEEARVDLQKFTIEGKDKRSLRNGISRVEKKGVEFKILSAQESQQYYTDFERISKSWLSNCGGKEKGFSVGYYNENYMSHFSNAVLFQNGVVVAFANLWETQDKAELSVDLMRYSPDAPSGCMDYLFTKLMFHGKEQGYKWFNLGMAPLSGLHLSETSPLWNMLGSFLYEHGARFYNFQGVRNFKEKYEPVWEPRYIAYKNNWGLPASLIDVTRLISDTPIKEAA